MLWSCSFPVYWHLYSLVTLSNASFFFAFSNMQPWHGSKTNCGSHHQTVFHCILTSQPCNFNTMALLLGVSMSEPHASAIFHIIYIWRTLFRMFFDTVIWHDNHAVHVDKSKILLSKMSQPKSKTCKRSSVSTVSTLVKMQLQETIDMVRLEHRHLLCKG